MSRAFVALGSNVGDRAAHVSAAFAALAALGTLTGFSPVFATAPLGPALYPFLNAVARLETDSEPEALLSQLLAIETARGRVRGEKWGPRILDLDLLAYDERSLHTPALELPHPQLARRDFVLGPLVCLEPELRVGGRTVLELWRVITHPQLTPYAQSDVPTPFGCAFGFPP